MHFGDQEKGKNELSAIKEIEQQYQIPVTSIIKLEDLISYLETVDNMPELKEYAPKVQAYRDQYGDC